MIKLFRNMRENLLTEGRNTKYYKYYANFEISTEDYIKLKKDDGFIKLISAIALENSSVHNRAKRLKAKILALIGALDSELSKKENY